MLTAAIQGQAGSYHDKAAIAYVGKYQPIFKDTFAEVFEAVISKSADCGVVAVENSLIGAIAPVYDLLRATPEVEIVGENCVTIHHSLIGLSGATMGDIREVYSHPAALEQCATFLRRELRQAVFHTASDTVGSVAYIKERGDLHAAAISSAESAKHYGLEVLREAVEDNPANYTRFLIIALPERGEELRQDKPNKTSLLIEHLSPADNEAAAGSLYEVLGCFAQNEVSLSKIESRPIPGQPWRYVFYLDCAAALTDGSMQKALQALDATGAEWRSLGYYRSGLAGGPQ